MPVSIRDLTKAYGSQVIFQNFNMDLEDRVINCILGPSGCGKTTLLNIIVGLDRNITGSIIATEGSTFSYIFQETRLLKWFTVEENLRFVLKGLDGLETEERIKTYLSLVSLWEYRNYYPDQLSGGMRQRLSIARAFAFPSDILLMDEPFKGQDPSLKEDLIREFNRLWEQDRRTVLFVTHDIDEVVLLADNVHILGGKPAREIYRCRIEGEKAARDRLNPDLARHKQVIYEIFKNDKGVLTDENGRNQDQGPQGRDDM